MDEADRLGQLLAEHGLLEEGPGEPGSGDADASPPVETNTPPAPSATEVQQPEVDPVLLDQKKRNAGLQRKLQSELKRNEVLESRLQQIEEALFLSALEQLPESERQARLQQFRREREVQTERQRVSQAEEVLEAKARALTVIEFSQTYGLPAQQLATLAERYEDADAFEERVALMAYHRGTLPADSPFRAQFEAEFGPLPARQPARPAPARFESVSDTPVRRKKEYDLDEAAELFIKLGSRLSL